MNLTKKFIRYGMFPVYMFGTVALGIYCVKTNPDWLLPLNILLMAITGGSIAIAERILPVYDSWNENRKDFGVDVKHFLVSMTAIPEILNFVFLGLLYPGAVAVSVYFGVDVWPHDLPLVIQVILATILAELGFYVTHRIGHEVDFFWRMHAVHHSAKRMYWVNAARDHPIGTIWTYVFEAFPMVLLGAPQEVFMLFLLVMVVHGLFQHCNIDVRLGWLNYFFAMGEVHRWHHVDSKWLHKKNYGGNLIIWDILLGTFYFPRHIKCPEKIGIIEFEDFPQGYIEQLKVPFIWNKLKRR